jgi:hypothetical protein
MVCTRGHIYIFIYIYLYLGGHSMIFLSQSHQTFDARSEDALVLLEYGVFVLPSVWGGERQYQGNMTGIYGIYFVKHQVTCWRAVKMALSVKCTSSPLCTCTTKYLNLSLTILRALRLVLIIVFKIKQLWYLHHFSDELWHFWWGELEVKQHVSPPPPQPINTKQIKTYAHKYRPWQWMKKYMNDEVTACVYTTSPIIGFLTRATL